MKAEKNRFGTALRITIVELSDLLKPMDWRRISLVLVDAIAEIRRLDNENAALREKVQFLSEDRDYWQHKWGNTSG